MKCLLALLVPPMLFVALAGYDVSQSVLGSETGKMSTLTEPLQFAFLQSEALYCASRKSRGGQSLSPTQVFLQLSKFDLKGKDHSVNHLKLLELDDQVIIVNAQNCLRWRLAFQHYWGTERTLDDQCSRIFHFPTQEIDQLEDGKCKTLSVKELTLKEVFDFLKKYYFSGSCDHLIQSTAYRYWQKINGGVSATAITPWDKGWPKGSKGLYFDFLPIDNRTILLFLLYDKEHILPNWSEDETTELFGTEARDRLRSRRNILKVWSCKNGERSIPKYSELIESDMKEPFYVFQKNGDYYFATFTGKIYVASRPLVNLKKIERLIDDLDSDTFLTREKATRELRTMGKAVQPALEAHLRTSTSSEQKRRLIQLIDEMKPLSHRETKLIWDNTEHPVYKLLFDLDKNMVFAFTKPNSEGQVFFFEIDGKPRLRHYTGKSDPEVPAALPSSTRIFIQYARFVRELER